VKNYVVVEVISDTTRSVYQHLLPTLPRQCARCEKIQLQRCSPTEPEF